MKRFGLSQEDVQSRRKWRRKMKVASGYLTFTWTMAINPLMGTGNYSVTSIILNWYVGG